ATDAELTLARDILEDVGSIDYASRVASEFIAKAKDELKVVKSDTHRAVLAEFADYMLSRKS
ncbi:MAG: polyprenyl synthetase family protein, partial [Thermoplasmata archaeon]